jgi:hypothetical protein
MTRSKVRGNVYYYCRTYKDQSKTACTKHTIKHDHLEQAVLYAIKQQVYIAVSLTEVVSRIDTAPLQKSQFIRLNELIASKEKELSKTSRYKQSIYQDWKDGEITHEDYRQMKEDYERQIEASNKVIANLKEEMATLDNGVNVENPFLASFRKYENINKLTRDILIELVNTIKVYENGNISIRFKFANEYLRVAEYLEVNTPENAV